MLKPPWKVLTESQRVYRSTSKTVAALVALIVFNGIAVSAITADSAGTSLVILGIVYVAVSTPIFARLAWAGVFVTDAGVHIANVFSSADFRWNDINEFAIQRWKLLPGTCVIHTRDGQTRPAYGLQESVNLPNDSAKEMVEELNRELSEQHAKVYSAVTAA